MKKLIFSCFIIAAMAMMALVGCTESSDPSASPDASASPAATEYPSSSPNASLDPSATPNGTLEPMPSPDSHIHEGHTYFSGYNTDKTHVFECDECGKSVKEDHNFYLVGGGETHFSKCDCGYSTNEVPHNVDGNGICIDCGIKYHTCTATGEIISYDDQYHYFDYCAECGTPQKAAHDHQPTACDYKGHIYACICGHIDPNIEIEKHSYGDPQDPLSRCEICRRFIGDHEMCDHTYAYESTGDTDHIAYCLCGDSKTVAHDINYIPDEESGGHYETCICGYIGKHEDHIVGSDERCIKCDYDCHVCIYPDNFTAYDDTYHYIDCPTCGNRLESDKHTLVSTYDDTYHFNKCECGYTTNKIKHTHDNGIFIVDKCSCGHTLKDSKGLEFEEVNGGVVLLNVGNCTDKYVIIPSKYNNKPVIGIASSAFEGNTNIVYVKIPDSVKSIGSSAFMGCTSLKAVNIPSSVTAIRDNTFGGCTSLERLIYSGTFNIKTIEMFAFMECKSFKGFREQNGNDWFKISDMSIGEFAFKNCKSLPTKLEITGNSTIEFSAFTGCSSIVEIDISANMYFISADTFSHCTSLKKVTIRTDKIDYMDINAFAYCTSLESFRVGYGTLDDFMDMFANSIADAEFGMSWFEGSPDFNVEVINSSNNVVESMKVSELYEYINEHYWQ